MFNFLKRIFKRDKQLPRITFELTGDSVLVSCYWPANPSQLQTNDIVQNYTEMLAQINQGRLLEYVHGAIKLYGRISGQEPIANIIDSMLSQKTSDKVMAVPVMSPEQVF